MDGEGSMKNVYNVYCDESRVDSPGQFMCIGGVMCPQDEKQRIVHRIHQLRYKHNVQGEFGWKTVCPSKTHYFENLINYFFEEDCLHFRCVLLDKEKTKFASNNDRFQKTYYQVFNNWLDRRCQYHIFIDHRVDDKTRIPKLRQCTINTRMFGTSVKFIEEVESYENDLIQLADLLIGALGYQWNETYALHGASKSKIAVCELIANHLSVKTLNGYTTGPNEDKFNVFHFGAYGFPWCQ